MNSSRRAFSPWGRRPFDHNFGQDLELQQIYGGGFGWTVLKTRKQEANLKGTIQYEKQQFITGGGGNQNLIGSTFAATYGSPPEAIHLYAGSGVYSRLQQHAGVFHH
jgi:hypothetical protein